MYMLYLSTLGDIVQNMLEAQSKSYAKLLLLKKNIYHVFVIIMDFKRVFAHTVRIKFPEGAYALWKSAAYCM